MQSGLRGPALGVLSFAAIAAIGYLDWRTGAEVSLTLFYVVPIAVLGWWVGPAPAFAGAGAATVAWFLGMSEGLDPAGMPMLLWNTVNRLVVFLFVSTATTALRNERTALLEMNARNVELLAREHSLARLDSLTELANSLAFRERLREDLPRLRRSGASFCLAYVDLDNFKGVNDGFGHSAGDEALRRVARILRGAVRSGDLVARIGGDEFALVLWEAKREAAEAVAGRMIRGVAELGADYPGTGLGATVGIAWIARAPGETDEVLRRADAALYRAKSEGKGRFAVEVMEASADPEPTNPGEAVRA